MNNSRNLCVLNYAMDSTDPVFGHQIEIVKKLADKFDSIVVITNRYSQREDLPRNVKVFTVDWQVGKHFLNVKRFFSTFQLAQRDLGDYRIFSHMTEVYSALLIPWTIWKRIDHYLWYAHVSRSIYLRLCHLFLTGIITSTPGSCPIKSKKVFPIGQGIDENIFFRKLLSPWNSHCELKAIHVGRIDPSKNIEKIIHLTLKSTTGSLFSNLAIVGQSTSKNTGYEKNVRSAYQNLVSSGKLQFLGSVERKNLPGILACYDVFVHAFSGSLDKSLVEATMFGMPVITCNKEYLDCFGSWGQRIDFANCEDLLNSELVAFVQTSEIDINAEVTRRQMEAVESHSLKQWIASLISILRQEAR